MAGGTISRRCTALSVFAALALAAPAAAAPIWSLDMHHSPTHFAPGHEVQYWIDLANVGNTDTSAPITLSIDLPPGITRRSILVVPEPGQEMSWKCSGKAGVSSFNCTTLNTIRRHSVSRSLVIGADVAPGADGDPVASATVEGGAAPAPATAIEPARVDSTIADFGVLADSFTPEFFEAGAAIPDRRAGAHPDIGLIPMDFNTRETADPSAPIPAAHLRDYQVLMPPGFYGDPTAIGECSPAQLTISACPRSSQVGRVDLAIYPGTDAPYTPFSLPLFNVTPARGSIADLSFAPAGNPVHIRFSLDPTHGYALLADSSLVNETLPAFDIRLSVWGVPADPSHDSERCGLPDTSSECPAGIDPKPFLTAPSPCGLERQITLRKVDSWQHPGLFAPEISHQPPGPITECEKPRFDPVLSAAPTLRRADTPTGLDLELRLTQNENPNAQATPPLRDLRLSLPQGMRISPSAVDGLDACSPAQIGLGSNAPLTCPDASRLGAATLSTPLLPQPLQGYLYLATPHRNPSQSLFALYLVVEDTESRGILLKLPGHLDLDPASGRITASFTELPQLPFESLEIRFRSDSRAPLLSGSACGSQQIDASVDSWAQPDNRLALSDTYQVLEGPDGSPCLGPDARPFEPRLSAGTVNPIAAARTPFIFRLSRTDRDQEIARLLATLPPGLLADPTAIPTCPDASIAAIPAGEGSAAEQIRVPSCPVSSRVGVVTIATGAGADPLYLTGTVYLAGPYRGAPFSLLLIVPALAGPFDLGTLTSRISVDVDPKTAQLDLASDQLPTILSGVPIDLRSIRLELDRPGLIRNPTSCEQSSVSALATSQQGSLAAIADRFQVGDCATLGLRPRLAMRLAGGLGRNAHPTVSIDVDPRPADANLRSARLALPYGLFLDPVRLRESCTRRRFAARECPPSARLGWAELRSPLLAGPERGRLVLLEGEGRLPDIAVALGGEVPLELRGHLVAHNTRIRASFDSLPDVPLSHLHLVLKGGFRGLLVNSNGLCSRRPPLVDASFVGHNSKRRLNRSRARIRCPR